MRSRAEIGYPPYSRLIRLEIRATDAQQARQEAERLHGLLARRIKEENRIQTSLIGPAPCYYPRLDNLHRWHVIVRGPDPSEVVSDLRSSQLDCSALATSLGCLKPLAGGQRTGRTVGGVVEGVIVSGGLPCSRIAAFSPNAEGSRARISE